MPRVYTLRSFLPSINISLQHVLSISIIMYFVFFSSVNGELSQPFNVIKKWNFNDSRVYGLASNSPISRQIQRNETAKAHLKRLRKIYRTYAKLLSKRRKENAPNACLGPPEQYSLDSRFSSQFRQINALSQICDTTLFANTAAKNGELDYKKSVGSVRKILTESNQAMFHAARNISVIPPRTEKALNWTRGAFRIANWDLREDGQRCSLERSFGYRKNGYWYIRAELTNAPVEATLEDLSRQYVSEFVREDSEISLSTIHFAYDGSIAATNGTLMNSTTTLERWGGRVGLSAVGSFSFEDIAALNEAHANNAIAVDIASDSITISNIAILALPMMMSIFPSAFVADLNTAAFVAYLVFTDIFSVLPLLIKGVELINSAKSQEAVFAIQLGDENFLQMEIFSAECAGVDTYRKWGIVFIVTSIITIIIGVALELIADHIMKKRRNEKGDMVMGPFGMAGLGFTKVSLLGRLGPDGLKGMKDKMLNKNSDSTSAYTSKLSDEERQFRYTSEKDRRYSFEESIFVNDKNED